MGNAGEQTVMLKYLSLALSLAIPFLLLYGLRRLSRWSAGRHDPIDQLIGTPRWCKDKAGYMNTVDQRKVNRAGEKRWQDVLRAQRKARKVPKPQVRAANVLPMVKGKRRM